MCMGTATLLLKLILRVETYYRAEQVEGLFEAGSIAKVTRKENEDVVGVLEGRARLVVGKRMSDVVVLSDDRLQRVNHKDKRIWG